MHMVLIPSISIDSIGDCYSSNFHPPAVICWILPESSHGGGLTPSFLFICLSSFYYEEDNFSPN